MFVRLLKIAPTVVLAMAAAMWAFGWGSTPAYAQWLLWWRPRRP